MSEVYRSFSKNKLYFQHEEQFFKQVQAGMTYRYYEGHYLYRDVKKAAAKYGVVVKYNPPKSLGYSLYGDCNFSVLATGFEEAKIMKSDEPLLFNVNELDI